MSDILIRGIEMPTNRDVTIRIDPNGEVYVYGTYPTMLLRAVTLPTGYGRLVDADTLRKAMYHEAFETDSPMQKWESGCWIRYKMFEKILETIPTIIPAEGGKTE